jgi:TusE/DsrC/DsvC family sulfur relay protein
MSNLEYKGMKIDLNEEGFMVNYTDWSEEVASLLAKQEEGLENLTPEHWAVINFIRNHYNEKYMNCFLPARLKAPARSRACLNLTAAFNLNA